jgi:hypothetical protein
VFIGTPYWISRATAAILHPTGKPLFQFVLVGGRNELFRRKRGGLAELKKSNK